MAESLRDVREQRHQLDLDELRLIDSARADGVTWVRIAKDLELTSPQAAQQYRERLAWRLTP